MKQLFKLLLVLLVLTLGSTRASAQTIKYLDYDRYPYYDTFSEASYDDPTKITSSSTSLSGWYYVEGNVTISSIVTLTADTYLILCDGAKLTINNTSGDGIDLNSKDLTIYAQSSGSHKGKLIIDANAVGIGIGGDVTINGGDISVTPTTSDGIICNHFILNGGIVTVDSPSTLSGINAQGGFTINGGKVSATGTRDGIFGGYVIINGGQVTATGDTGGTFAGIRSGSDDIDLGWTNATDFIKANSYSGTVKIISGSPFNYEGGTLAGNTTLTDGQKTAIANKTLTPNTTSYTITKSTGITGGTIEVDKDKAKYYERVAITVTPEAGNILGSLTYTYGDNTYTIGTGYNDIKQQANDYVFNMPSDNVTINATFGPAVAQIGATQYTSLDAAFDAVNGGETKTIDIIADIVSSSSATYVFSGTKHITINLNGHTVTYGSFSNKYGSFTIQGSGTMNFNSFENVGDFTIKDAVVNCKIINNPAADATLTFDNSTVICGDGVSTCLQWYQGGIVLKNGAKATLKHDAYIGAASSDFTLNITDGGTDSWMKLENCTVGSYNPDIVSSQMQSFTADNVTLGYSGGDVTMSVDGGAATTTLSFTLKKRTHAVTVNNGSAEVDGTPVTTEVKCGKTVTITAIVPPGQHFSHWSTSSSGVTFANATASTTTFTMPDNAVTVTANYTDALTFVNNLPNTVVKVYKSTTVPTEAFVDALTPGDEVTEISAGEYVVLHIVPNDGYWTDVQLLAGMEAAASLAPKRALGLELGRPLTLLKADTYHDASGDHDRNDGLGWYYYQIPASHTASAGYISTMLFGFAPTKFDLFNYTITQDATTKTVTVAPGTGWTAEIAFTPESTEVPFNATVRTPEISSITVKKDGTEAVSLTSGFDKQLTVSGGKKIGNCPMTLKAANDFSWFLTYTQDNTISFTINVPLTVDDDTATKGTSTNPWRVRNIDDMKLFAQCVNDGEYKFVGEHVKLTDNLTYDATSSAEFKPVGLSTGSPSSAFCGTFDGNHMTISNLEYTNGFSGGYCTVGLFGQVGSSTDPAFIKDLTLSHCTFYGGAKDGAFVGALAGGAVKTTISGVNVINCILKGPEAVTPLPGGNVEIIEVGGLVGGIMDGSQITNCIVKDCDILNEIASGVTQVNQIRIGGIAGDINDITGITGCTVDHCVISADYDNGNGNCLGGLVGNAYGSTLTNNRVKGSTSISDVTGLDKVCFVSAIYSKSTGDVSTTTISNNTYDYDVTLSRTNSEGTKSAHGYTKRGLWNNTSSAWEDVDGAMMYIKQATLPAETANGSKVEFNEVTKGTDRYDHGDDNFYYAVGAPVTLKVTTGTSTDGDIRTFYDQLSTLTMNGTDIKDALGFTMPEADATIAATFTPSDWFTILPTNTQYLMSLYHEWEPTGAVNYAVSDGTPGIADADKKTIVLSTVTAISDTEATTKDLGGVSYAGIPTIISCKDATGAEAVIPQLRFDPKNDAPTAPTPDSRFKGTTTDKLITPNDVCYVLNTQGKFILTYVTDAMPAVDKTLKAHRCYIDMSGSTAAPVLSLVDGSGTTSLENVRWQTDDEVGEWFTLDGRKLSAKPTTKGLYIFNGKKVVIR